MSNNSMLTGTTGDFPTWPLYPQYGGLQQPTNHVLSLGWQEQELLQRLVEALERLAPKGEE